MFSALHSKQSISQPTNQPSNQSIYQSITHLLTHLLTHSLTHSNGSKDGSFGCLQYPSPPERRAPAEEFASQVEGVWVVNAPYPAWIRRLTTAILNSGALTDHLLSLLTPVATVKVSARIEGCR
jgi:hypothetical protein